MLGDALLESRFGLAPELGGFSLAAGARRGGAGEEGRQDRLARNRAIGAAARDLDGVVERLGQVGEQLAHLGAGLEIMLRAQPPPVVDRDIASLGDADQRVMRLEILCAREIGLVGGDDGKVEIVGKTEKRWLDAALLRQAVALQLDIEPVAENGVKRREPAASKLRIAVSEREVDHPFRSAGQRDQALGVGGKIGNRGDHLTALGSGEIGVGRELHQIGVAGSVLGKKRDAPIGAGAAQLAARAHVLLGGEGERQSKPDDRLDANFGEALREFERTEQIV